MGSKHTSRKTWAIRAAVVAMFVAAAFLARSAPVASVILLAVPTTLFGIAWWVMRGYERVALAAKRGDLDALATIAKERKTSRYLALVTLAMHGGVERVRDLGDRVFCVCGDCDLDENDRELEVVMRSLALVEAGHADRAFTAIRTHALHPKLLPPAPAVHVAVMLYANLMSGVLVESDLIRRFVMPSLRAPIDLALTQCLADRGLVRSAAQVLAASEASNSPRLRAWREALERRLAT